MSRGCAAVLYDTTGLWHSSVAQKVKRDFNYLDYFVPLCHTFYLKRYVKNKREIWIFQKHGKIAIFHKSLMALFCGTSGTVTLAGASIYFYAMQKMGDFVARKKKPKPGTTFERLVKAVQRVKDWERTLQPKHQKFLDEWYWSFENDPFAYMDVQDFNQFQYILEKYDI